MSFFDINSNGAYIIEHEEFILTNFLKKKKKKKYVLTARFFIHQQFIKII